MTVPACCSQALFVLLLALSTVLSAAVPAPPAKTGRADDGGRGVAWPTPRFTDHANGTVTDHLTGLIWLKHANFKGRRNFAQALSDCAGLKSGDVMPDATTLSDGSIAGQWRLPSITELQSLIDASRSNPALPAGHPFGSVQSDDYLSATSYVSESSLTWFVSLNGGKVFYNGPPYVTSYVWPVRGGP